MRLRLLLVLPGAVALSCGLSPNPDIPSIEGDGDYSMDADGGDGDISIDGGDGDGDDAAGSGGANVGTGGAGSGVAEVSEHAGAGGEVDE